MIKDVEDEIEMETAPLELEEMASIKEPKAEVETAIDHLEEVRRRAYLLWQSDGEPDGRDQDYWYRAEREIAGE